VESPRWLLLGHQLPTRSSNARVKTWRRLQQIGAVPARNSVYVLPNTEQCREDFEWIRSEIVALGGEATVFAADAISVGGTEDIVAVFQRTREQEFRLLKRDIDRLLLPTKSHRSRASAKGPFKGRTPRVLRERFTALERIDFFPTAASAETAASLLALEQAMEGSAPLPSRLESPLNPASFHDRRWVTRPRPGVDRMASAWLIRRFIDRNATFAFVEDPNESDVPFDMYTGDFSHEGNRCTFEVLADRFGLNAAAVLKVGRLVHDLDMKDTKYGAPEAPVVDRLVEGLRALHADDAILLEQGIGVFDALARSFESDDEKDRTPRLTRRTTRKADRRRRTKEDT
jgi:hypothetical protein